MISYVSNASGPKCTTYEELESIAKSDSHFIMMKTCTIEPLDGNPKPRYALASHGSIQAMGLPNPGFETFIENVRKLKRKYPKRQIVASVYGFNEQEYLTLVSAFQDSEVDMIEVNVSCPNVERLATIDWICNIIRSVCRIGDKPIGFKLPPLLYPSDIQAVANAVMQSGAEFITCINSVPNALIIDPDTESTVIRANTGMGGLCGGYIKPIALSNVWQFYKFFRQCNHDVLIFGAGGIVNGDDAFEFLLCGADMVQIATVYEQSDTHIFTSINNELEARLRENGHDSLHSVKGKLKLQG